MTGFPPPPPTATVAPPRSAWRIAAIVVAVLLATSVAVGLMVFAPQVIRVEGHSMDPGLRNDDRAIFARSFAAVGRGEIVAYRYPRNPAKQFSGRIVGLPGERLAIVDGVVRIDGRPLDEPYLDGVPRSSESLAEVQLGPDQFYVLGDNRGNSSDSREWGPVDRRLIGKRFVFVWWRNPSRVLRPPATGTPSR